MKELQLKDWHPSMRGYFAGSLYNQMINNDKVVVITADLGYGLFDRVRDDFPARFYNFGAAEQASLGIAVGMAQEGLTPIVYSITPFLLYRGFETLVNYINWESTNVKLIGSGRSRDYKMDGRSHWADEAPEVLKLLPNIHTHWPDSKEEIPPILEQIIYSGNPEFISLRR